MKQQASYHPVPVPDSQPIHIALDHVTMAYPMAPLQRRSIKVDVMGLIRPHAERRSAPQLVTALDDVSLVVSQGERLGIVGHNGAGKSSLLRLIAGVYLPQSGAVTVVGRVQAIFDIATGFEAHATGRDNIIYRGLVMGLAPEAIRARVDEIIRFADIGEFIDLPLRTYSTGMAVRLAFAISTCLEGDILLIDEIFGAGDMSFASKAKSRMKELVGQARIVCFASHDLATIRDVCTRAVWVHGGKIRADGDVESVTRAYEAMAKGATALSADGEQIAVTKSDASAPLIGTPAPHFHANAAAGALEATRLRAENAEFMLAQQQAWARTAVAELERFNTLVVEAEQRKIALQEELERARREARLGRALRSERTTAALGKLVKLSAANAPMFVDPDLRVSFAHDAPAHTARVAVVSIPKAGTYMLGTMLQSIGYIDSGIHGAVWGFSDRRFLGSSPQLSDIAKHNVTIPIADYIDCLRPGDFLLSHLPPSAEVKDLLRSFKIIFAVRDPRDCCVSFMRYASRLAQKDASWLAAPNGPARMEAWIEVDGRSFFDLAGPMADWAEVPGVLTLRYEDFLGGSQSVAANKAVARLQQFLAPGQPGLDLDRVLGTATLTSSGSRTVWRQWWSERVEDAFRALGGPALAERFGYREPFGGSLVGPSLSDEG